MLPHPATALIAALNHLLQGNDWARKRLAPYAGRQALIGMPPWQIGFVVTDTGGVDQVIDPLPDVTISMPADAPFRLLEGLDRLMSTARVEGNAEFATELSFVFRNLRWDAAEDLSRIFGDVAAQRMVQAATGAVHWQRQAARHLADNVIEYLTMENAWLLPRHEFDQFQAELTQLDATLSRLEAHLSR
jgi:ubiquinone biosynthesis protein UbiJ